MKSFSLLADLSTSLIIVLAVAAVLIAGGIVGVLVSGKIAANKKDKGKTAEKPVKAVKPKPSAPAVKTTEQKLEIEEVKTVQPAESVTEEVKPEPVEPPVAESIEEASKPEVKEPVIAEEALKPVEEPIEEKVDEVTEGVEEKPETVAEPVPEPIKEFVEEPVHAPVPESIEETEKTEPLKEQKPERKVEVVKSDDGNAFVRIRYNRSFTAKLIQSDEKVKNYYSLIKNELKKYPVKERTSWRYETFKSGRKLIAKITLRGKTLCLYCALNASDYDGTKYKVEDVSSKKSNADVPALFRIKNDRRAKYSEKIIADLMAKHALEGGENKYEDYAAQYPYEDLEPLIERKLVKLLALKSAAAESEVTTLPVTGALPQEVLEEVAAAEPEIAEEVAAEVPEPVKEQEEPVAEPIETVEEVAAQLSPEEVLPEVSVTQADEILPDEKVEIYIKESEKVSDKTKRAIVNIDTLGKHFKAGEKVTLEEIKRRVPDVNKKTP